MASHAGNNAFKIFRAEGDLRRNAHLDWLELFTPSGMAEGFKIAADRVIEHALQDQRHPDIFFYPAAYLYRHYLELHLKILIQQGTALVTGTEEQPWGHELKQLWARVKRVLTAVWPDADSSALTIVDDAIAEFSILDPDGQSFRYYTNGKGQTNLQNAPRVISLEHLHNVMGEVYNLLAGCECGIDEYLSQKQEMEHEQEW